MKLAYVCAPLAGDIAANIKKAREYSRQLVDFELCPISMHLAFDGVYDDNDPNQRKTALEICLRVIEFCDYVVVFGYKITEGMALEIETAEQLGIPIVYANARLKNKVVSIGA
jgi:hypothetical protein